ncbi:MAG: hypothetical protein LIV24_07615 [Eubacterium sp.]|nr:hypothetical protein [Eubacterium sp.]
MEEDRKEKLAILLQRRYNILQELKRQTDDLGEAFSRDDEVSANLVLRMRSDQFSLCEQNWEQILMLGEEDRESAMLVNRLVRSDPETVQAEDSTEEKILNLRRRIRLLIHQIQEKDRMISLRNAHEASAWYKAEHPEEAGEVTR